MIYKIIYTPKAKSQLVSIYDYIRKLASSTAGKITHHNLRTS